MIKLLLTFIFGLFIAFVVIFGIDSEIARQDKVKNGYAENCIFSINCK